MEVTSTPVPQTRYIALGDSYSSGQGVGEYVAPEEPCRRSKKSYPYLIAQDLGLGNPLHLACGGAVTDDFVAARNEAEPAQIERIPSNAEVVTLTIGGNDAIFDRVMKECVRRPGFKANGCSRDPQLQRDVTKQIEALKGNGRSTVGGRPVHELSEVYGKIYQKARNAKIYVSGYPEMFGRDLRRYTFTVGGYICPLASSLVYVSYENALWIYLQALSLNIAIAQEVREARQENPGIQIEYVPVTSFDGHNLCDRSDPWINGVALAGIPPENQPKSFHPNFNGESLGFKKDIGDAVRRGLG